MRVRMTSGGPETRVRLEAVDDQAVITATSEQVRKAEYVCPKADAVWSVVLPQAMKILKVNCGGGVFQVTLFDGKAFVKLWTGTLAGQ